MLLMGYHPSLGAITHARLLIKLLAACCSFFGQWGPNATTWLLPSELFPTETRAMSHGLAAATGKVRCQDGQPCRDGQCCMS